MFSLVSASAVKLYNTVVPLWNYTEVHSEDTEIHRGINKPCDSVTL